MKIFNIPDDIIYLLVNVQSFFLKFWKEIYSYMNPFIKLYSSKENEINRFLNDFLTLKSYLTMHSNKLDSNTLEYKIDYDNPVIMSDIIGVYVDNFDDYKLTMWISIDKDVLINITQNNANDVIKYLYERFPY